MAGARARSFATAGEAARVALQNVMALERKRSARGLGLPPPVVFDIDDTLITDRDNPDRSFRVIPEVVTVLRELKRLGCDVHLVTAREDCNEALSFTLAQLKAIGLPCEAYRSLHLCPRQLRGSARDISRFKARTRRAIAQRAGCPLALTVGDQWTDIFMIPDDSALADLDRAFSSSHKPYVILRPNDGVAVWGLKLLAVD